MHSFEDELYMSRTLELARRGQGSVSPNPLVGCVMVREGEIMGEGWHERYGGPHAEVNAVAAAGGEVAGATAYINLEPCAHYGKTSPCAELLIEKGVSRVVFGMRDPNPKVNGAGERMLREAGIEVESGVLETKCKEANAGFVLRIKEGRPCVTLKIASSLDGRIALEDGSSKWITGEDARRNVHLLRAANDAVLTGIGTVLADDPLLTVRAAGSGRPLRVVLDRKLLVPEEAKILDASKAGVLIITGRQASAQKIERLRGRMVEVEQLDCAPEHEVAEILALLSRKGVNYLMIEAGLGVTGAFINARKADRLALYLSPKIIGRGRGWSDNIKIMNIEEALRLKAMKTSPVGHDILIEGVFACSPDL